MQSVKMLKPYYVKRDETYLRIILAFQYFSIEHHGKTYHFIPLEAREIIIDRRSEQIVNTDDQFVFQHGKEYLTLPLYQLMAFEQFETYVNELIKRLNSDACEVSEEELLDVITTLEHENFMRLIDQALENRDEAMFNALMAYYK
ncbi:IDEAL domain-containing protein [Alkalibacillus sp. S2W]|uniref:IDEAL domain-containing protein n=1 Tax=Alkalibacillus sp. S2W TaxID=3386553 RepID=UPI00398D514A